MQPLEPSTLSAQPSSTMQLCSYTCLAFLVNRVIETGTDSDLAYEQIFDAASEGRLIWLLAERYGHLANFTFVTRSGINLAHMEATLADAAAGYDGRIGNPTGPVSGLCLVMDIILEAIQQQFHRPPVLGAEPAPDPSQPFLPFMNRHDCSSPAYGDEHRDRFSQVWPPLTTSDWI